MILNYLKVIFISVAIYKIVVGDKEGKRTCKDGRCENLLPPDSEPTTVNQFPHTVFVYIGTHKMSGSVLNQKIILGCLWYEALKPAYIIAGIDHTKEISDGIRRNVSRIIKHKCGRKDLVKDAIALYILEEDLPLGATVKRVLISKKFPDHAVMADATAFDEVKGETDYLMIHKRLRIMSQKNCCLFKNNNGLRWQQYALCAENISKNHKKHKWSDRHLGGPLVAYGYHQIGIAVWTPWKFDNVTKGATVFLNVSYYYNWIVTQAEKYSCENTTGII